MDWEGSGQMSIESTTLVKQLKALDKKQGTGYWSSIDSLCRSLREMLAGHPPGAEGFTNHDIGHSERVLEAIGKILPKETKLNAGELYTVVLAALLHDIGMWVRQKEAAAWMQDPESGFCRYFASHGNDTHGNARRLETVRKYLNHPEYDWIARLGLQRLAAEYARSGHPQRAFDFLTGGMDGDAEFSAALSQVRGKIESAFIEPVAAVCLAHGWDREMLLDAPLLKPRELGGELVCLPFLAVLLRLGDLLDLGSERVPPMLWEYLTPLEEESEAHWWKEKTLRRDRLTPDCIEIAGEFHIDAAMSIRDKAKVKRSFALASNWIQYIVDEADFAKRNFPASLRLESPVREKYRLGALTVNRDEVRATGLRVEDAVFRFDRDRIITLLGEEIYGDPLVFVRELMQNALDATRCRMADDLAPLAGEYDLSQPWTWPENFCEQYPIVVETGKDGRGAYFRVRDRGTGMTYRQICDYFLQAGQSYYQTEEAKKRYRFPVISYFGIGFLSCLFAADVIEVETKSASDASGWRLHWSNPSRLYMIEETAIAEQGTSVTLWLNQTVKNALKTDPTPFEKMLGEDCVTPMKLNYRKIKSRDRLAVLVRNWCLWHEMPIRINEDILKRCDPKNDHYSPHNRFFSLAHNRSIEIEESFVRKESIEKRREVLLKLLRTERGVEDIAHTNISFRVVSQQSPIGEGCLQIPVLKGNNIPLRLYDFRKPELTIIGVKGILTNHASVNAIRLYHDQTELSGNMDWHHIPFHSMTASRSVADERIDNYTSEILRCVRWHALRMAYKHIIREDTGCAALWYLAQDEGMEEIPWRLPCRTREELVWETLPEIVQKHGRVIVVPLSLAINGPWENAVPCVGLPQGHAMKAQLDNVNQCCVVEIPDTCSGVLYPHEATLDDVVLFTANATYLFNEIYLWGEAGAKRILEEARPCLRNPFWLKTTLACGFF